jgi:hypothetical protein
MIIKLIEDVEYHKIGDKFFFIKELEAETIVEDHKVKLNIRGKIAGDRELAEQYIKERFAQFFNIGESFILIS